MPNNTNEIHQLTEKLEKAIREHETEVDVTLDDLGDVLALRFYESTADEPFAAVDVSRSDGAS